MVWGVSRQFAIRKDLGDTYSVRSFGKLAVCVIGCELAGFAATPLTISAITDWYAFLNKPLFSPPNWLFGPVWTVLYFLMGISLFLVWKLGLKKNGVRTAIKVFLAQLALNFLWSVFFFGLRSPLLGLIDILTLLVMIILTMQKFRPLSKAAFYLLVPYLLWVGFATLLNFSILVLN